MDHLEMYHLTLLEQVSVILIRQTAIPVIYLPHCLVPIKDITVISISTS